MTTAKSSCSNTGGDREDEPGDAYLAAVAVCEATVRQGRLRAAVRGGIDERLADVLDYMEEQRAKKARTEPAPGGRIDHVPLKPAASKTWRRMPAGRGLAQCEAEELDRWVPRFHAILVSMGAPVLEELEAAESRAKSARGLLGGARLATVKIRVRAAEALGRWTMVTKGHSWPQGPAEVVDYLHKCMAEEPRVSLPRSTAAMLSWFEVRSGFEDQVKISESAYFKRNIEAARVEAEDAATIKKAPRIPALMIVAMELGVLCDAVPLVLRVVLWSRLLKIFGVLRADDLRRLGPHQVLLQTSGFTATLKRTKTTGAGKKVRDLSVFIPAGTSLSGAAWMEAGYELFKTLEPKDRDFFLPRPQVGLREFSRRAATVSDITAMNYRALLELRVPVVEGGEMVAGEVRLLDEVLATAWTGHSERSTLPSALAACGVAKQDRDPLGRWSPSGSDDYVRSYRALVKRVLGVLRDTVKCGRAYEELDEDNAWDEAVEALVGKGGSREDLRKKVEGIRSVAGETLRSLSKADQEIPTPQEAQRSGKEGIEDATAGEAESDAEENYVIAIYRGGRSQTLHKAGGCWRAQQRRFQKYTVLPDLPSCDKYTRVCRDCWARGMSSPSSAGEATSDSSSSTAVASSGSSW